MGFIIRPRCNALDAESLSTELANGKRWIVNPGLRGVIQILLLSRTLKLSHASREPTPIEMKSFPLPENSDPPGAGVDLQRLVLLVGMQPGRAASVAERVADLEAERDLWRARAEDMKKRCDYLEKELAKNQEAGNMDSQ